MISIVIPVYNEEENIPELYRRITSSAEKWGDDYEVVIVDDGSSDLSLQQLEMIHRQDPHWKVLSFSRNFGHQAAVSAGLFYCHGDVVAIMDADLQDPPEELLRFLEKWREGYHVVYAIRTKRKEGLLKRVCYKIFYRVLHGLASIDIPVDAGDFCVMDRAVVEVLKAMPERTRFVRGLRSWSGFRQVGVAYERSSRHAGAPKYTFSQLVRLAVTGILLFSSIPLKLAAWCGFCLCAASLLSIPVMIGWALVDVRLFGMRPRDVAGWTSMVSLILLLSGLQLLALGVIGQYLARIFDEVQGRPPWIIASALGFPVRSARHELGWFAGDSALWQGSSARASSLASGTAHDAERGHDAGVV
jgi:glycosyltransferase involved in cell wall biosynthesis